MWFSKLYAKAPRGAPHDISNFQKSKKSRQNRNYDCGGAESESSGREGSQCSTNTLATEGPSEVPGSSKNETKILYFIVIYMSLSSPNNY